MLPVGGFAGAGAPCVTVCAFMVDGADADYRRFQQDVQQSNIIFRQCGFQVQGVSFQVIGDRSLLDFPDWYTAIPQSVTPLFGYASSCAAGDVIVFYIRSTGGAFAGAGSRNMVNGRPGFVVTDVRRPNTFAHELAHILFGGGHSTDPTNILLGLTNRIVVDPPRVTAAQCQAALTSPLMHACLPALPTLRQADVAPLLLSPASDGEVAVRGRAAAALAQIGGPSAIQALAVAAQLDGSPVVRLNSAYAVRQLAGGSARPVLLRLLLDPDEGVRRVALNGITALSTRAGTIQDGKR
ncbi:MAG: HEAT repeat domain-containing protein [Mycobacterium leprae]